jgi:HEAT repeat protein
MHKPMSGNFFNMGKGISDRMEAARANALLAKEEVLTSNSFDPLASLIIDHDKFVSQPAITIVKTSAFEIGTSILYQGLLYSDERVQNAAIAALLLIGTDDAIDAISSSISVQNAWNCNAAIDALAKMDTPYACSVLIDKLALNHYQLKLAIAARLGNIRAKEATEALASVLRSGDENLKVQAIVALGKIQNSTAVPHILRELRLRHHSTYYPPLKHWARLAIPELFQTFGMPSTTKQTLLDARQPSRLARLETSAPLRR